jgi:hypothetical protein
VIPRVSKKLASEASVTFTLSEKRLCLVVGEIVRSFRTMIIASDFQSDFLFRYSHDRF